MAKKYLYCIDYRNMNTAIHGLIAFNDRKSAEIEYTKLKTAINGIEDLLNKNGITQEQYSILYDEIVSECFNHSIEIIEEVNFRHFKEVVRYGKLSKIYADKYIIVNNLLSIDLYC